MRHRTPFEKVLSLVSSVVALTCVAAIVLGLSMSGHSQTFSVIYNFTGSVVGAYPLAGVTIDRTGNLYTAASMGGLSNRGAVCKLTHQGSGWTIRSLYSFGGPPDASTPIARIVIGPDGSLYGTTEFGGRNCGGNAGCGTVYRLQPPMGLCRSASCPWTETLLYRFSGGGDGANPGYGDLVFDASRNIYGTTFFGGLNAQGVVFKLTHSGGNWTESAIYQFGGLADGFNPFSGVLFDNSGNLYGTTSSGGANGYGTVYELSPSGSGWTESTLYSFDLVNSGGSPYGGVILDSLGNLYGGTSSGGSGGAGTIYQLSSSGGSWSFDLLWNLSGTGYQPGLYSNLVQDAAGSLYGTTNRGGANGFGSVFKLTRGIGGWTYISLHDFIGTDGAYPYGVVAFDGNGNLFGTTKNGGSRGYGVVWEITP